MQSVIAQDSIGDDSTQTLNLQTNIELFPRRSVHWNKVTMKQKQILLSCSREFTYENRR